MCIRDSEALSTTSAAADRWNHLLAVLAYLERDALPEAIQADDLPSWLGELRAWCVAGRPTPKGLLGPGATAAEQVPTHNSAEQPASPAAPLPRLITTEPEQLLEQLSADSIQKRSFGLLRLLQVDPDDQEVIEELQALRLMLTQLLLDVSADSLETLYRSPIGDLYRQLVQSSLCRRELSDRDQGHRDLLMQLLLEADTGRDEALLLAVALFHPIERIEINLGTFDLPAWLPGAWRELSGGSPAR